MSPQEYCPVCRLPDNTVFQLQGVCRESTVDRLFVLQPGLELLGYTRTRLARAAAAWQIRDLVTGNLSAFTNSTADLPLGTQAWWFTDGSGCRDQDSRSRLLNLHLAVKQPGIFCCG